MPIDLGGLIEAKALRLEHATVDELARFATACRRPGLGSGEIELLALALARGFDFCTADLRAMRTMRHLGLESRWHALEELLQTARIDSTRLGPEHRRDAWR